MVFWIIDLIISLVCIFDLTCNTEPFIRAMIPDAAYYYVLILLVIDAIWAFCAIIIKIIKKARKKSKLARQQQEIGK